MKLSTIRFSTVICMTLFSSVFFTSCKKETTTPPTNNGGATYTNSFSYKKNGISQAVNSVTKTTINLGGISYIAIAANTTSQSQVLNLWIDPASVVGSYSFGFVGSDHVMQYSNSTLPGAYTSDGGNLNISKHDISGKIIEGTFYGTVYDDPISPTDSVIISSGAFKISY